MPSPYLLTAPRPLFKACLDRPECKLDGERCGNPDCPLTGICPLSRRDRPVLGEQQRTAM